MNTARDLNDSLDNLFAGDTGEVRTNPVRQDAVEYRTADDRFSENCPKCRGTGRFVGYSGRSFGQCFACKGVGKRTFKTSPEARAKARQADASRKERNAEADRQAFKAAHPDEYAWMLANVDRFDFATKMWNALGHYGHLTEGQLGAITKMVARDAERDQERKQRLENAPAVEGADRLKEAFDTAKARAAAKGRGIRNLRLTIGGMVISPASATSNNAGALYVKDCGEYLGKINGGKFFAVRACRPEQQARVLAFVADPAAAAKAYGQETGMCCVCNSRLTNEESMSRGIGPVCAEKFGW